MNEFQSGNEIKCYSQVIDADAPADGQTQCVNDGTAEICVQRVGDQLITVRRELPSRSVLRPIAVVDDRIGQRRITFNFDLVQQADPPASNVEEKRRSVENLMQRFGSETNVNTLAHGSSYMAVVRKLAFASLGVSAPLNELDQRALIEMVSELAVKHQPLVAVGTVYESEITCDIADNGSVQCAHG